jgi:hypothetical protein
LRGAKFYLSESTCQPPGRRKSLTVLDRAGRAFRSRAYDRREDGAGRRRGQARVVRRPQAG